jgi:anti-sigma-K factor RskA
MAVEGELHDLAPAYALGVLDDDERAAFDAHLASCATCRAEIESLGDAAAALAYAAEGPEPPNALKQRIVEAAVAERGRVVPLRRRWTPQVIAVSAVAAALAIGLGLWATLGTSTPGSRAQTVALQGAVGTLDVSASGDAVLTVQNLKPAPAGKTYELWVIKDEVPSPAGTFTFGGPRVQVHVSGKVTSGSTVGVTLERRPGASKPTPPILFSASIPA